MVYEGNHYLGDYFTSRKQKGFSGLPLLSVTLHDGLILRDQIERRTETNLSPEKHLFVKEGDIAYNMMRMWQGALGRSGFDGIVSPAYVVLSPNSNIDSQFAEFLFNSQRMIYLFWAYSYGLTKDRLRLYFNDFKRIPVNILALPEQKKIAKILSTWDKAITTTEQLIANSQQQKKALMQQLLTGKKRLAGFSEEWEFIRLGDLLDYEQPTKYIVSSTEYDDSYKLPVLTAGKSFVLGYTNEETGVFNESLPVIIFDDFTTALKFVDFPFKVKSSAMKILKIRSKENSIELIYETMKMIGFCASDHKRYWISEFQEIEIKLPPKEEQQEIAKVILCANKELEAQQQKLEFLKQEKKALMQQLLTGKRRVKLDD